MAWKQKQYDFTRQCIASRRQKHKLLAAGYHQIDPTSGQGFALFDAVRQAGRKIEDVAIGTNGDMLFVKLGDETIYDRWAKEPISDPMR